LVLTIDKHSSNTRQLAPVRDYLATRPPAFKRLCFANIPSAI
jgi:hypothetical protein